MRRPITQRQADKAVREYLRPKPYTPLGLSRLNCAHCGDQASRQWSLRPCAVGRVGWYPLCVECDVRLNALVMDFLQLPDREERLRQYTDPAA